MVRVREPSAPWPRLLRYTPRLRLLLLRFEVRDPRDWSIVVIHCRSGITSLKQIEREVGEWTATLWDLGWVALNPPRRLLLWKGAASALH